jgi:hypothetical protein
LDLANILHGFSDLISTADLRIYLIFLLDCGFSFVDLIRILDCDFIVELLVDPNLDKTIVGSADFASNLGGSADLYAPFTPPPPIIYIRKNCVCRENAALAPPQKKRWHPRRPWLKHLHPIFI